MKPVGLFSPKKILSWYENQNPRSLGQGRFGRVWEYKTSDGLIAVKEANITREQLGTNPSLLREASLMLGLDHPNILHLDDVFFTSRKGELETMDLIFPRAIGNLLPYIETVSNNIFKNMLILKFLMIQIIYAVAYLHMYDILHGDLNPENILIQSTSRDGFIQIWVSDFGISTTGNCQAREKFSGYKTEYTAPEVRVGERTSFESDSYSIGVIFYAILTRKPYRIHRIRETKQFQGDPIEIENPEIREFLHSMLNLDPSKRINPIDLFWNPWFNDVRGYLLPLKGEKIRHKTCLESLKSSPAPLPAPIRRDEIKNFQSFYHPFLKNLQTAWEISDRIVGLVITMFESVIYRVKSKIVEDKYLIYFYAVFSLVTQVMYLDEKLDGLIYENITNIRGIKIAEVKMAKREILSNLEPLEKGGHYAIGFSYFMATSHDFMLIFLKDYRLKTTYDVANTLLQIAYYTKMNQLYSPIILANMYVFLGTRFSAEDHIYIDVNQRTDKFKDMLLTFQLNLAEVFAKYDGWELEHCARGRVNTLTVYKETNLNINDFVNEIKY